MTREDLIQRLDRHKKSANKSYPWMLGFLALLAAFAWWSYYHEALIPKEVRNGVLLGGLFAGFYGWLFVAAFFASRERRKLELFCPKCKGQMIGISAQVIVASGRCGKCGTIILEDWNK